MSKDQLTQLFNDDPNIFIRHPELLTLINLSDDRNASSLLEKQISTLKNRLQNFQSQQHELFEVARENEQISDSFSRVICQLIGFNNLSEFASEFPKALRTTFEIDEVSFKTTQAASRRPQDYEGYEDTLRRLVNDESVCDNRWPSNIKSLFFSPEIKSAALVPMKNGENGEILGVLALGSKLKNRYTNELGTAHLSRLGIMAGICLARLQPSV
jgi:uncharacterized protein YigA (DUF484 family)